ncbi:MAG: hypothetical protein QNJ34_21895 [Xenococcaceae cyanobacterium MO_188.B29]|nr:hypothetical protein [Xenococcaceae cyanobacterium MO_188.B29]
MIGNFGAFNSCHTHLKKHPIIELKQIGLLLAMVVMNYSRRSLELMLKVAIALT